ncbi:MAG: hypothetical protein ACI4EN_03470 [Butyrivibrio sp.]
MVNKRKVRLMARTAMYEKHEGGKDLPKAAFYKSDYVSLHMWCTAIAVTLAYILIAALIIACNFEYIVNNLTHLNYTVLAVISVMIYIAMMTFFLLVSYFVYSYRFIEAENGIKIYQNRLHKIFLMNKEDRKRKGGAVQ